MGLYISDSGHSNSTTSAMLSTITAGAGDNLTSSNDILVEGVPCMADSPTAVFGIW